MIDLILIGIGTGSLDHLTLGAIRAINAADLILIPEKGPDKADLADLRRTLCAEVLTNPATRLASFTLPTRDPTIPDYRQRVDQWHDAIAHIWRDTIAAHPEAQTVALLVWGDPALYDSTLRIAARLTDTSVRAIPGIMSLNALTAAHAITLNEIGAPFLVTTGRRLTDEGWPAGIDTLVVMLDGDTAFRHLAPEGITIWWGAYVGMPQQCLIAGPLTEAAPRIIAARTALRAQHGWIMDCYLLRKAG